MDRDTLQKEIASWTAEEKNYFFLVIISVLKQSGVSIYTEAFTEIGIEPIKNRDLFVPSKRVGYYKLSQNGLEIVKLIIKGK